MQILIEFLLLLYKLAQKLLILLLQILQLRPALPAIQQQLPIPKTLSQLKILLILMNSSPMFLSK